MRELSKETNTSNTWRTEAPLWRNWRPLSAESIPPVAKMGNPGKARAMADTALKAIGLIAVPAENEKDPLLDYRQLENTGFHLLPCNGSAGHISDFVI